jgi:hypothetical protein
VKPKPAAEETEAPAATAETKPAGEEPKPATTAETEPPKPGDEKPAAETEPPKATAKPGKSGKGKTPPKPVDPNLDDATKYKNARSNALEDAQIKELRGKADSAIAEDEAHRASVAYNKALFRKIRELDPSLDGYVDKLEDVMMKRLNAEKRGQ